MFEILKTSKEILEIQGFKSFFERSKRYLLDSDHDLKIKKLIKEYSKDYNVFIDIGAGIREIVLSVAPYFSKCICIEPSIQNFEKLKSAVKLKRYDNVIAYNFALGEKKEEKEFFLSENHWADNRFSIQPGEKFKSCIVKVVTLDDMLDRLNINEKCLIKMDVQGAELQVVKGATKILDKKCVMISEFWPWGLKTNHTEPMDFIKFMRKMEYNFYNLDHKVISENHISKMCSMATTKKHVVDNYLIK